MAGHHHRCIAGPLTLAPTKGKEKLLAFSKKKEETLRRNTEWVAQRKKGQGKTPFILKTSLFNS